MTTDFETVCKRIDAMENELHSIRSTLFNWAASRISGKPLNPDDREQCALVIKQMVSAHFGVSLEVLASSCRTEGVVWPRQIAMYLLRQKGLSLEAVGAVFRRDHGTVIHAINRVNARRTTEPKVAATINLLTKAIGDNAE